MSLPEEDSCLRTHFANLREEDRSSAPPFGRTAAAAAFSRRNSSLRMALAAMSALAIAVMLAVRTHRSTDTVPRELAAWSSPTAFLLETPGRQLLNQTPRLGEPLIHSLPATPGWTQMKPIILTLLLFSFLAAQQPPEDPLRDVLFPPEVVMQHQQAVGLSDEQKNNLKVEVRQAQLKFTELQWTLQDEMERLVSLVKQSKVDEKQAASQLDKVLAAEHEIKRAQLMLLIRIKNNLTAGQQTQLRELIEKSKVK